MRYEHGDAETRNIPADADNGEGASSVGHKQRRAPADPARADEAAVEEVDEGDGRAIEGTITEEQQKEIADKVGEVIAAAVSATRSESYSGMLPHPEHWDKFDSLTRERILRMSEAFTTDESGRRDRLVDAEISEAPKGRQAAFIIMMASLAMAALSVFAFQNVIAAGIFLALPVANTVTSFIRGRNDGGE